MRSSSNSNYNSYENLQGTMLQNLNRQSQILSRSSLQSSQDVGQCQNMIQQMKNKISFLKEKLNPHNESNTSHQNSRMMLSQSQTNMNFLSQKELGGQPTFGQHFYGTNSCSNRQLTSSVNEKPNNANQQETVSGIDQLSNDFESDSIIKKLNRDYQSIEQKLLEQVQANQQLKQLLLQKNNNFDGQFDGESLLLQQQVRSLEERLEESHRQQHRLENVLEEYEVNLNRIEENLKQNNKKFHDIQKKYSLAEQQKKELNDKLRKMEQDKNKLSEKWVKLSAKNKTEERQKSKLRELEVQSEYTSKEINNLSEKLEKLERENIMLRKTSEGSSELQHKQLLQIRKLNDQINDMSNEKNVADKVTNELLQRVKKYEDEIQSLHRKLQDTHNRSQDTYQHQESFLKEMQHKDSLIWRKEEMIEELKKDAERINQMLISKDMDNQNLKQALAQLQNEMGQLQQELEILNQYAAMKSEATNDKFPSQQVMMAYQSLLELLSMQYTPFDDNSEIEISDVQSFSSSNVSLIYDSEIQFTILKAEQKLRSLSQYFMNMRANQMTNMTSPTHRPTRVHDPYQNQNQQDQNLLNRQLKISNLIIQNHAGVQENNKIININTNSVICNKENRDNNNLASSRRHNIPPLHTQSLDNFNQVFHEPRTTKNVSTTKNSFQRKDSISKVLGPQKITNTPNALFQQNFQAFKQKGGNLSNTQQLNQALLNYTDSMGKNNSLRYSGQGSLSYRSTSKDQQQPTQYGQRKNSCRQ